MELNVENDKEHAEKAAPDAHLQKLPCVGHNGRREQERRGHGNEPLTKSHIFEDGPIGKPTKLLEIMHGGQKGLDRHK